MTFIRKEVYSMIEESFAVLAKKGKIKATKKLESEVKIWCKNANLAQQYFDAICFLSSINKHAAKEDIIYDMKNAKDYIDLELPGNISSLQGLKSIFKIASNYDDLFDYEKLCNYADFAKGEHYVKGIKVIPPIKIEEVQKFSKFEKDLFTKLEAIKSKKEPSTALRLNAMFLEAGQQNQITDEMYRIMYEALESQEGKINAMISYLDFTSQLTNILVDLVTVLILSEKSVRIMFRSSKDSDVNIHTFRTKVENRIRELYFAPNDEDDEFDRSIPVELDNPRYFRQWDTKYITPTGDKLIKDVCGNLHSKVLMNHKKAIVSSANMIITALESNVEVGVKIGGKELDELQKFFDISWRCMHG